MNFFENVNLTCTSVMFIEKYVMFTKKRWIVLKYLLHLQNFNLLFHYFILWTQLMQHIYKIYENVYFIRLINKNWKIYSI